MKHSTSRVDLEEHDFGSLNQTGADLSRYADQLARERNSRTLTLRIKRPSISSVFGKKPGIPARPSIFSANTFPFLDPDFVVHALSGGNQNDLNSVITGLTTAAESSPNLLSKISNSFEVAEAFCNAIASNPPAQILVAIMGTVAAIYPTCGEVQDGYIDNGLPYSLLDFLQSENLDSNSESIVGATIALIAVIAGNRSYGRDALLCTGLIEPLISLALNPTFMESACGAICAIFENPAHLESETLMEVIPPISQLLSLPSKTAVEQILLAYVAMTNKDTAVVTNLHEIELPSIVIPMLDDPELVDVALKAVGNLSVAQPPQIRTMLDLDLMAKLRSVLESQPEFIPDVFWILSNLLEAYSAAVLPAFDESFLAEVLETATGAGIEAKKEACFFLSTVVLFSNPATYGKFINPSMIDVLVEMLACGVGMITIRCIDTILAFVRYMTLNTEMLEEGLPVILDTDIMDRLEELGDTKDFFISERALCLMHQLQELSENHE